ncbi:unnamed protein product [Brachionus calyciflorus]|uniref:Uncharacterized protein n=1 Tax=Brachionus calyciflorus TaxID=104777 RepID=A0A814P9F4_9BILA|nr:unnamed protein product [Brachionus calyciflorus]
MVKLSGTFFSNDSSKCVYADLPLTINNWRGFHRFMIMDNMTDEQGILGFDFLRKYKWIFDPITNNLEIQDDQNKIDCIIANEQTIPPRTESVIEAIVNIIKIENDLVFFEPGTPEFDELGIASSLDTIKQSKVKMNVIYLSNKPVVLKKNAVIGSLERPTTVLSTQQINEEHIKSIEKILEINQIGSIYQLKTKRNYIILSKNINTSLARVN